MYKNPYEIWLCYLISVSLIIKQWGGRFKVWDSRFMVQGCGGGFAEILRLRSQLFWHSLSLIRRFSPLRMTKRGDARFRYSNRKSHFPRPTSCPSGIPLPEEGGRCIISLIPSHQSLLTRSTCKPVILRFLLLSSALPLYRYVPTGGPHRCGRSDHRPQSACRSGGGDRACR